MRVAVPLAWKTQECRGETRLFDRHRRLAKAIADRKPAELHDWMGSHFDEAIGASLGADSVIPIAARPNADERLLLFVRRSKAEGRLSAHPGHSEWLCGHP